MNVSFICKGKKVVCSDKKKMTDKHIVEKLKKEMKERNRKDVIDTLTFNFHFSN